MDGGRPSRTLVQCVVLVCAGRGGGRRGEHGAAVAAVAVMPLAARLCPALGWSARVGMGVCGCLNQQRMKP